MEQRKGGIITYSVVDIRGNIEGLAGGELVGENAGRGPLLSVGHVSSDLKITSTG
jgi:hypothetical protein